MSDRRTFRRAVFWLGLLSVFTALAVLAMAYGLLQKINM